MEGIRYMMWARCVALVCALWVVAAPASAKRESSERAVSSKIDRVMVYYDRALVTRVARIDAIPAGVSDIIIPNLPPDVCVEVPVLASRLNMQPMYVGDLPRQVVPLTSLNATCETLAVEAALTGDPRLVFQAIASDPLTAAVLSLAEIRDMVNAMLKRNKPHLPQFKTFQA